MISSDLQFRTEKNRKLRSWDFMWKIAGRFYRDTNPLPQRWAPLVHSGYTTNPFEGYVVGQGWTELGIGLLHPAHQSHDINWKFKWSLKVTIYQFLLKNIPKQIPFLLLKSPSMISEML